MTTPPRPSEGNSAGVVAMFNLVISSRTLSRKEATSALFPRNGRPLVLRTTHDNYNVDSVLTMCSSVSIHLCQFVIVFDVLICKSFHLR